MNKQNIVPQEKINENVMISIKNIMDANWCIDIVSNIEIKDLINFNINDYNVLYYVLFEMNDITPKIKWWILIWIMYKLKNYLSTILIYDNKPFIYHILNKKQYTLCIMLYNNKFTRQMISNMWIIKAHINNKENMIYKCKKIKLMTIEEHIVFELWKWINEFYKKINFNVDNYNTEIPELFNISYIMNMYEDCDIYEEITNVKDKYAIMYTLIKEYMHIIFYNIKIYNYINYQIYKDNWQCYFPPVITKNKPETDVIKLITMPTAYNNKKYYYWIMNAMIKYKYTIIDNEILKITEEIFKLLHLNYNKYFTYMYNYMYLNVDQMNSTKEI